MTKDLIYMKYDKRENFHKYDTNIMKIAIGDRIILGPHADFKIDPTMHACAQESITLRARECMKE